MADCGAISAERKAIMADCGAISGDCGAIMANCGVIMVEREAVGRGARSLCAEFLL